MPQAAVTITANRRAWDQPVPDDEYRREEGKLDQQSKYKITPEYKVLNEEGPHHQRLFTVGVYIEGKLLSTGKGGSKKEAEENGIVTSKMTKKIRVKMSLSLIFSSEYLSFEI